MTDRVIIVGVDLSEPSVVAARWTAAHLADGAKLVLAHAVDVREPPSFLRGLYPPSDQLVENARRGAEIRLREIASSVGAANVVCEIRTGRPDDVLTALATEYQAELLVVGLHGERSGIWKVLGSTAERVARHAPTSVLLGRQLPLEGPRRVLIALDDSGLSADVIAWGTRMAGSSAANALVLHVANPLHLGGRRAEPDRRRAEAEARELTQQWITTQLAGTALESATVLVEFGDAGFEILGLMDREGADMLVMGRHSRGGDGAGFMGSVVEFLLRNGNRPVLVVDHVAPK